MEEEEAHLVLEKLVDWVFMELVEEENINLGLNLFVSFFLCLYFYQFCHSV